MSFIGKVLETSLVHFSAGLINKAATRGLDNAIDFAGKKIDQYKQSRQPAPPEEAEELTGARKDLKNKLGDLKGDPKNL